MSEDRLLQEIARTAIEEEEKGQVRLDSRWDRLSAGTLAPEEEAELRALAEESDEARRAYEAFRPLDAAFRGGVVRAVKAEIRAASPAAAEVGSPAAAEARRRVLPFARRRRLWLGGGAAAAALAAALVLTVSAPAEPLPDYAVEIAGGRQEMRSSGEGSAVRHRFVAGDRLEITLRPATAVSGRVEARCFLERGGELRRWEPAIEADAGGAFRIAGDLAVEAGDWILSILIGRPGRLPDAETLLRAAEPEDGSWQVLRTPLRIAPDEDDAGG